MKSPLKPGSCGLSNIALVLLVLGSCAAPSAADTFTWSWDYGTDDWYGTCCNDPPDECSADPVKYWTYNNWGQVGCASPVFPGPGDNVSIGSGIELWQGSPTIQDLTLSGELIVHYGRTLTIGGDTVNSGHVSPSSDGTLVQVNGSFTNTAAGSVSVVHGGTLAVAGGSIANDGSIWLRHNTGMGHGKLRLDNDLTVSGAGELLCGADIYSESSAALTNAAGHTIRYGKGAILVGLTNDGTINADRTGDAILLQDPAKTNNAMMEATNGGFLDVYTTVNQSTGGVILADGGTVRLHGGQISGGTLDSTAGSKIETVSGTTSTVTDLTNESYLHVLNNTSTLVLSGVTLTNNGTIELTANTGMGDGRMRVDDDVTLDGSGKLLCGADIFTDTNNTLTNGGEHTIRYGKGSIIADLINDGTVDADRGGNAIALQNGETVNNGTMRASNGGFLDIYTTVDQSSNGLIAADGGTVRLRGGTISGGTLDSTGSSTVQTVSGTTSTVTDLTNNSYLDVVNNGSILVVDGATLTNNGTIELTVNTGMGPGEIRLDSDVAFTGTGEVYCRSKIYTDTGNSLTNEAEHTIRGTGDINVAMVNNGTIKADYNGRTLYLNAQGAGVMNYGTLIANAGCELEINSASLFTQVGGETIVNGTLDVNGAALDLQGGSLEGEGTVTGSVANAAASVEPGHSAGTLTVTGDYSQGADAELHVELGGTAAGEYDKLNVTGTATLDGTLRLSLIDGFRPTAGDTFQIVQAGARTGQFATEIKPRHLLGMKAVVTYTATGVTLEFVANPSGGSPGQPGSPPGPAETNTMRALPADSLEAEAAAGQQSAGLCGAMGMVSMLMGVVALVLTHSSCRRRR